MSGIDDRHLDLHLEHANFQLEMIGYLGHTEFGITQRISSLTSPQM